MLLPVCSTPSSPSLPLRVCSAAGGSERPEPAARAPLFPRTFTGNAGERGSRPNLSALRGIPKAQFGGCIPNVQCEWGSLGNFSLLWITTSCSGMGRAGLELLHVTARVSPGRGLCHPGQPPKLPTSLPETCAGQQVSAKRTGDPLWHGDGAARLQLPGKVPSAIPAFQRAVTAVREWQPPAGDASDATALGQPGDSGLLREGRGAVVGWRKG